MDTTIEYSYSAQVDELMMALAKAQAKMANPPCDSKNPHFNSKYASLTAIRDAVIPPLASEGIAVLQLPATGDSWVRCTTMLWYKNQYLRSMLQMPVVPNRRRGTDREPVPQSAGPVALMPQDYASALTWAKRISLQAVCTVAGDEDDDGNSASGRGQERDKRPARTDERVDRATGEVLGHRPATASDDDPHAPATVSDDDPRTPVLQAIAASLTKTVTPLKHPGLYKALLRHCFEAEHYTIKAQSLMVLEAGLPLFRHLCEVLDARGFDRTLHPDEWIAQEQRTLAALARGDAPSDEGQEDAGAAGPSWGPESPNLMDDNAAGDREPALRGDSA